MIGRGSRVLPKKKTFNVIDLGNNARRFGLWEAHINWTEIFKSPNSFIEGLYTDEEIEDEFVFEYSDEMKKLKQISDALVEVKISTLIAEQNEAFKIGIKETGKLMSEARDRFALGQLFGKGKATNEGVQAFSELNKSIEELIIDVSYN